MDINKLRESITFLTEEELTSRLDEINDTIKKLTEHIKDNPIAVGMAAPQLGISLPIFVIKYKDEIINCINPKLEITSDAMITSEEGCLSFPGYIASIIRAKNILATFFKVNKDGIIKKDMKTLNNEYACIYQHELDHLLGVTIFDYAQNIKPSDKYLNLYSYKVENDFILQGETKTLFKKLDYDGDYKLPIVAHYRKPNESTSN